MIFFFFIFKLILNFFDFFFFFFLNFFKFLYFISFFNFFLIFFFFKNLKIFFFFFFTLFKFLFKFFFLFYNLVFIFFYFLLFFSLFKEIFFYKFFFFYKKKFIKKRETFFLDKELDSNFFLIKMKYFEYLEENSLDENEQDSSIEVNEQDFGKNFFYKINNLVIGLDEEKIILEKEELKRFLNREYFFSDLFEYLPINKFKYRKYFKKNFDKKFFDIFLDNVEVFSELEGFYEGSGDHDSEPYYTELFKNDEELYNIYLEYDDDLKQVIPIWEEDDEQFFLEDFSNLSNDSVEREPLLFESDKKLFNLYNSKVNNKGWVNFNNVSLKDVNLMTPFVPDQYFFFFLFQDLNLVQYNLNLESFFMTTMPFLTEKAEEEYEDIVDRTINIEEINYAEGNIKDFFLLRDFFRVLHFDEDYSLNEVDAEFEDGDYSYNFLDFKITGEEINAFSIDGKYKSKVENYNLDRFFLFRHQQEETFFDWEFELPFFEPDFIEYTRELYPSDIYLSEEYIEDSTLEVAFFGFSLKFNNSFFGKKNFLLNSVTFYDLYFFNIFLDFDSNFIYKINFTEFFLNFGYNYNLRFCLDNFFFFNILNVKKEVFNKFFFKHFFFFFKGYNKILKLYKKFFFFKKIKKKNLKIVFFFFFFFNWNQHKLIKNEQTFIKANIFSLTLSFLQFFSEFELNQISSMFWEIFFLNLNNKVVKVVKRENFLKYNAFFSYIIWKKKYKNFNKFNDKYFGGFKNILGVRRLNLKKKKNIKNMQNFLKTEIPLFFFFEKKNNKFNFFINFLFNLFFLNKVKIKNIVINKNSEFSFFFFKAENKKFFKKLFFLLNFSKNFDNLSFFFKNSLNFYNVKVKLSIIMVFIILTICFLMLVNLKIYFKFLIFFLFITFYFFLDFFFFFSKFKFFFLYLIFWLIFSDFFFFKEKENQEFKMKNLVLNFDLRFKYNSYCNNIFELKNIYMIYFSGNYNFWKYLSNFRFLNSDFFLINSYYQFNDYNIFFEKFLMSRTGYSSFFFFNNNLYLVRNYHKFLDLKSNLRTVEILKYKAFKKIWNNFEGLSLNLLSNSYNKNLLNIFSLLFDKEIYFLKKKIKKVEGLNVFNNSIIFDYNQLIETFFQKGVKYEVPINFFFFKDFLIEYKNTLFYFFDYYLYFYVFEKLSTSLLFKILGFFHSFFFGVSDHFKYFLFFDFVFKDLRLFFFDDFFFFFKHYFLLFFSFFFFFKDFFYFNNFLSNSLNFKVDTLTLWYFFYKYAFFNNILKYRQILNSDIKYLDTGFFFSDLEKNNNVNHDYFINLRLLLNETRFYDINTFILKEGSEFSLLDSRIKGIKEWLFFYLDEYYLPFSFENFNDFFNLLNFSDANILFEYLTNMKEFNEDYYYYYFKRIGAPIEEQDYLLENFLIEGDFESNRLFFFELLSFNNGKFFEGEFSFFFDIFFKSFIDFNIFNFKYSYIFQYINFYYFFELFNFYFFYYIYLYFFEEALVSPFAFFLFYFFKLFLILFFFIFIFILNFFYYFIFSYLFYLLYFFDLEKILGKFWENFGFLNFFNNFYFNDYYYYFFFLDYILPFNSFLNFFFKNLVIFNNNEVDLRFREFFYFQQYLIHKYYLFSNLNDVRLYRSLPLNIRGLDHNFNYSLELHYFYNNDFSVFSFFF